jgi:RNA polymerase sigma factor (sigma-70 family)
MKRIREKAESIRKKPMPTEPSETSMGGVDAVTVYLKELVDRPALTRDEERRISEAILHAKDEVSTLVRGLLLKAADTLQESEVVDAGKTIRVEISRSLDDRQLDALTAKIRNLATLAAESSSILEAHSNGETTSTAATERARRLLAEIGHGFGMSAEDLARSWAAISEERKALEDARRRLFEGNLRLVISIARRFEKCSVEIGDLVQEGNVALMRAVETFDPQRGVPFAAFAGPVIRRAMAEFVRATSKPVRVPKQVDDFRRRIRHAAWYLASRFGKRVQPEEIAEYLEVPKPKVVEALSADERSVPLDVAPGDEEEPLVEHLADPRGADPADLVDSDQHAYPLDKCLAELTARDRRVIELRYGSDACEDVTLEEVGRDLGVTRERARQLEARALRSLRLREQRGRRGSGSGGRLA